MQCARSHTIIHDEFANYSLTEARINEVLRFACFWIQNRIRSISETKPNVKALQNFKIDPVTQCTTFKPVSMIFCRLVRGWEVGGCYSRDII